MERKILIACYEVPGYGGANTVRYLQFERMQKNGLNVSFVNLIGEQDHEFLRAQYGDKMGNPRTLPNVFNCVLQRKLFGPQPALDELVNQLSPDVILGGGYIAAFLLKQSAPATRLVYRTSGCLKMKQLLQRKLVKNYQSMERLIQCGIQVPYPGGGQEKQAVYGSDLIIVNSPIVRMLYSYFYPSQIGKLYTDVLWEADFIYHDIANFSPLIKPFSERDIDVLFVASDWNRPEKNFEMVKKIISECRDLNIHVAGKLEEQHGHAIYHGLVIDNQELFSLFGRAKSVVCPSLFDAAPGILFEASGMGCNVVASRNCGNWQLCHSDLLVDPYTGKGFAEKIRLSLTGPLKDNRTYFENVNSYEALLDILTVI